FGHFLLDVRRETSRRATDCSQSTGAFVRARASDSVVDAPARYSRPTKPPYSTSLRARIRLARSSDPVLGAPRARRVRDVDMAEHVMHARDCRYRVAPTAAAVVRVEEQPDARVPQRAHELGGTIDVVPPPPTARPRRGAVRRSKSLARPRRGLPPRG